MEPTTMTTTNTTEKKKRGRPLKQGQVSANTLKGRITRGRKKEEQAEDTMNLSNFVSGSTGSSPTAPKNNQQLMNDAQTHLARLLNHSEQFVAYAEAESQRRLLAEQTRLHAEQNSQTREAAASKEAETFNNHCEQYFAYTQCESQRRLMAEQARLIAAQSSQTREDAALKDSETFKLHAESISKVVGIMDRLTQPTPPKTPSKSTTAKARSTSERNKHLDFGANVDD